MKQTLPSEPQLCCIYDRISESRRDRQCAPHQIGMGCFGGKLEPRSCFCAGQTLLMSFSRETRNVDFLQPQQSCVLITAPMEAGIR